MKRFIWILGLALLATPVLAQDFGDGGFGGDSSFNSSFNDDSFGDSSMGPSTSAPEVDVLADVRRWLDLSGAPRMDKKQEKSLKRLYNEEVKAMAKVFQTRFGVSLESAIGAQGRRQSGSAERGAEVRRLTGELTDKVIAGLHIDQQASLRRYQSEKLQVSRRARLNKRIELAHINLTPEQQSGIDALFARETRFRTLIIIEAKGGPSQEQVSRLEAQTSERIVNLLDPAQKDALVDSAAKSKTASLTARP